MSEHHPQRRAGAPKPHMRAFDQHDEPVDPALAQVAVRCLERRNDLYDNWIALVRSSGRYRDSWVDESELRAKANQSFELILRGIAGEPVSDDLLATSDRVGERRADQGVSLAEVQAAANLDFQVIWEALLNEADPNEAAAMLRHAPQVWAVVDNHTRRISQAYQRRVVEMDRLSEDYRREWFRRLLKSGGERPDVVQEAAAALGFDPEARFMVSVADRAYAAHFRNARDTLAGLGRAYHYQEIEVGDLLVVPCTEDHDQRLATALACIRCAIAPAAHGLDEVPNAIKIASAILSALPPERTTPGRLKDAWFAVAAAQAPLVVNALAASLFDPLENVPDAETLIETALAYCNGDGTVSRVANQLYCHRNTVLNRLEKLRELTGHDVRRPRDAAAFLFVLSARPAPEPGLVK
jgi:hypothetical protein